MEGRIFQKIMRGTYVNGLGYSGWTQEEAQKHLANFSTGLPKVTQSKLQRNKKSYTLTWSQGKESYKALFSLEEDAFGGPVYREGNIVILSSKVESKPLEKESKPAKKGKKSDKSPERSKKHSASWKPVDNAQDYAQSHIVPLFYHLCLQSPPKGVVFV